MRIFLHTKFSGVNQARPDLISIALVSEDERGFYAALPESNWTVQCTEWVHFNVLPHLWGADYEQSLETIREHLTAWIESFGEEVVIVTDCAASDFPCSSNGCGHSGRRIRTRGRCSSQHGRWAMIGSRRCAS